MCITKEKRIKTVISQEEQENLTFKVYFYTSNFSVYLVYLHSGLQHYNIR